MTIEEILKQATAAGASDIHIAPGSPIMFRIHGQMRPEEKAAVQSAEIEALLRVMMTKEQLAELKKTGEAEFVFSLTDVARVRVNVFRQRSIYALSLRMLPLTVPTPEMLGIPKAVTAWTEYQSGLILITGNAGCGKSVVLASLVAEIAKRDYKNILTLEKTIEYLYPEKKAIVSQREIGLDTESYAEGIRAALHQDADVIMLGELRDAKTVSSALTAAETGHLVLAAVETADAADALEVLTGMFASDEQNRICRRLAAVLRGIVAQQLLPCLDARGRIGVFEVLNGNEAVKTLIRERKFYQIQAVMQKSRKEGMQSMDDAILEAYMRSEIAMETALAFAKEPDTMKQKVCIF